jgi:hypothetical protein
MFAGTSRSVQQHQKKACHRVKMRCYNILKGGSTPFNLFFSILKILMGKYHFLEG